MNPPGSHRRPYMNPQPPRPYVAPSNRESTRATVTFVNFSYQFIVIWGRLHFMVLRQHGIIEEKHEILNDRPGSKPGAAIFQPD